MFDCEFCKYPVDLRGNNALDEDGEIYLMHYDGNCRQKNEESWTLQVEEYDGDFELSVDIKYCPMCGRKLVNI